MKNIHQSVSPYCLVYNFVDELEYDQQQIFVHNWSMVLVKLLLLRRLHY